MWAFDCAIETLKRARITFSLELNAAVAHRHDHLGGHTGAPCCYSVSFRGGCVAYGKTLLEFPTGLSCTKQLW